MVTIVASICNLLKQTWRRKQVADLSFSKDLPENIQCIMVCQYLIILAPNTQTLSRRAVELESSPCGFQDLQHALQYLQDIDSYTQLHAHVDWPVSLANYSIAPVEGLVKCGWLADSGFEWANTV